MLAIKYRPKTFDDVVGQELVVKTLTNELHNNTTKQAYIFEGYSGVSKTTCAYILANELNGNSSTFTNEVEIDRSLLTNKRYCTKPTCIIKFGKTRDKWFTLWNDKIIKRYNNEHVNNVIAMNRYLDEVYDRDAMKSVIDRFDYRAFLFTEIATFKTFQKNLRLMKNR